jgi:hypothetical protein
MQACTAGGSKCILTAKLEGQPHTHLVWCANGTIVGAIGCTLHYINSKTGKVVDRIPDSHTNPIKGLVASHGPVKCGNVKEAVVVSCGMDSKARAWVVPAQ